jgi:hypothetical protein
MAPYCPWDKTQNFIMLSMAQGILTLYTILVSFCVSQHFYSSHSGCLYLLGWVCCSLASSLFTSSSLFLPCYLLL